MNNLYRKIDGGECVCDGSGELTHARTTCGRQCQLFRAVNFWWHLHYSHQIILSRIAVESLNRVPRIASATPTRNRSILFLSGNLCWLGIDRFSLLQRESEQNCSQNIFSIAQSSTAVHAWGMSRRASFAQCIFCFVVGFLIATHELTSESLSLSSYVCIAIRICDVVSFCVGHPKTKTAISFNLISVFVYRARSHIQVLSPENNHSSSRFHLFPRSAL